MNVMLKNFKHNCDMHSVAPFAAFAISIFDFNAEPFGSAFFIQSHPGAEGDRIHEKF